MDKNQGRIEHMQNLIKSYKELQERMYNFERQLEIVERASGEYSKCVAEIRIAMQTAQKAMDDIDGELAFHDSGVAVSRKDFETKTDSSCGKYCSFDL